ncbi:MAG: winged helix-turn-helix domain-containing protein [Rikenellaceae bacterium]|nr:winged helix-turn-helix domain-containing protein [Rikenellaceae bacterium]
MPEFPKYKMVYEALRKQIADKTYLSGDLLPSENRLCARYRMTRPTVRKALDQLVEDGFIIR